MKKLDPIYLLLRYVILAKFFKAKLTKEEKQFILDNIKKHRKILWLNIIAAVLVYLGMAQTPTDNIMSVVSSLIAPVVVTGGAWFAISFGGIPAKLVDVAMLVTFWMFTGFVISLSSMFIAIGFVTSPIIWPVFIIIYLASLISCINYDSADGLKAGLDEFQLRHSRAALSWYSKEGVDLGN